jgi:hypothetical protein
MKFYENVGTQCPNGWYQEITNPSKCIKFVTNAVPFFGANFDCIVNGNNSSLLSISSSFENSEILSKLHIFFRKISILFLLKVSLLEQAGTSGSNKIYIGLTRNGNSWTWANGDSSTYTNWQSGKFLIILLKHLTCLGFPTNDNTKNCVTFNSGSGSWTNEDCDTLQSYVCQLYV